MDELNLKELRDKCVASLYECTENISKYIDDENERSEGFNKVKSFIVEYCKMEQEEQAGTKAVESLKEVPTDVDWESLKILFEGKLAQYTKQQARFDKHLYMKELYKQIKTAEKTQEENNLEQDVAITLTQNTYTDPITKKPISNPVRNKICNHVYDKESIESIVSNRNNRGCPYVGCSNNTCLVPQILEPVE